MRGDFWRGRKHTPTTRTKLRIALLKYHARKWPQHNLIRIRDAKDIEYYFKNGVD